VYFIEKDEAGRRPEEAYLAKHPTPKEKREVTDALQEIKDS